MPTLLDFPKDGHLADQIRTGFKDMTKTVKSVLEKWPNSADIDHVFTQYFPLEYKCAVETILNNMANSPPSAKGAEYGSEEVGTIMVTNQDFGNLDDKSRGYLGAKNDKLDVENSWLHIGPRGYEYPHLANVDCKNLEGNVFDKMQTLGGYLLIHELS